jgi:DNA-binding transcriptional LysR family regulator
MMKHPSAPVPGDRETGGFTARRAAVSVTQPTLSVGIAELERLVGAPLFVRDRRNVG